ncbi:regulatory helix-turn-helix protein, lysR family [Ruminococcus sp. YE71]|uniref:LysR family transcriptional regulator n=1 Tax=unclassified Ruminococcus TaxID=2608920 RepID=UPI0008914D62|nr:MULTISPECIES: LysR family transcriptional regulator [unclassified Ruminococcus]SDA17702.1 regulatory helix-turn-helix protein, lysR family [Ruminococcus sp. YE78]SFW27217.1 regulatory helix-turn-helix protein, lysR family [Ruminococcus sp. YE71]
MNSQQVEYILAVAECRSFSKAAKMLFVTQPSLSQYIINAEQKLGFAVFDRSCSPVALTPEGEIFVEYAKRFRELETELNGRLEEHIRRRSGALRVVSEIQPLPKAAADALAVYADSIGDVDISSDGESGSEKLSQQVADGSCDAAVTLEKPQNDALETVPLTVWLSVRRSEDRSYPDERLLELVRGRLP